MTFSAHLLFRAMSERPAKIACSEQVLLATRDVERIGTTAPTLPRISSSG
jgi:hypothetical protein